MPRTLIYFAGFGIALILLSPFWVLWIQDRYARNPIILSDDTADLKVPPATKGIEFERFTAHFYNSTLKEVWLVRREQRSAPAEQSEVAGPLSSQTGIGVSTDELTRKLDSFAFHRSMTWTDAQYRVEATIHYSSAAPAQCRSMLALHMSTAAWLKKRQPLR